MKRTSACRLVMGLLMAAGLVFGPDGISAPEAQEGPVAPQGVLLISRPVISWKVEGKNGSAVTAGQMLLDGRSVPLAYSVVDGQMEYRPPAPLPPGMHTVSCKAAIDGITIVRKEWRFSVAGGALPDLPPITPKQRELCEAANNVRRLLQLPPFRIDARLCAAAQFHCQYAERNRGCGHSEVPGRPGFTGASPWDRMKAFGYALGAAAEGMSGGEPEAAVAGLVAAPYHRMPFLYPGNADLGTGHAGSVTMDYVYTSPARGLVVYPVPGQTGVPLLWGGGESPDPLRIHRGAKGPFGYPIVFACYSPQDSGIVVRGVTLRTEDGRSVPFYLNTPTNDSSLKDALIIIPTAPLKPGARYLVAVSAATSTTQADVSRAWEFETAGTSTSKREIGEGPTPPDRMVAGAESQARPIAFRARFLVGNTAVRLWIGPRQAPSSDDYMVRLLDEADVCRAVTVLSPRPNAQMLKTLKVGAPVAVAELSLLDANGASGKVLIVAGIAPSQPEKPQKTGKAAPSRGRAAKPARRSAPSHKSRSASRTSRGKSRSKPVPVRPHHIR